jgi:hypothetical protein
MKKMFTIFACILLSFHGFSQSWSLTGNSGTNPSTNFLGTTDANRLVFRTNSTENMTILPSGNVGIGTSTPIVSLNILNNTPDHHLLLQGVAPSLALVNGSATTGIISSGRFALATGSGQFVATSVANDVVITNADSAASILFGTNIVTGDGVERMRITSSGYVGIANTNPLAKFDVDCSPVSGKSNPSNIRFENLQSGSGTLLVIDSNGYVYKSASGASASAQSTPLTTDLQNQVEELKNQVQELRSLLTSKLPLTPAQANSLNAQSTSWLGDNFPNPSTNSTTIEYSLPAGVSAAVCQLYSLDGKLLKSIALNPSAGKGQLQLGTSTMASGMYIYSLTINGKIMDTKKLTVTN